MSDDVEPASFEFFEPPTLGELAQFLPQYQIEGFIAQGGMGAVYLARQPALDRQVAIKVLPPSLGGEMDFAARFQIEARAMAKLHHSNIISVYDFGVTSSGHLYLVMEYVHGETLHRLIQNRLVTTQHALSYAMQLCEALQYAHDHGIIHRDIKPSNVLIDADGRLKVADFGLARPAAAHDQEVMMGTPDYAAPEITAGLTVDHRADIYAFGVLIYEMLTRTTPRRAHKLASVLAGVDPAWDDIIARATQPQPQDRYAQVKEMRVALSLVATRGRFTAAAGAHAAQRPPPPPAQEGSRSGMTHVLLAGAVVTIAVALGFLFMQKKGGAASADDKQASASSSPSSPPSPNPAAIQPTAPVTTGVSTPAPVKPPPQPLKIDVASASPGHLAKYPAGHKGPITGVAVLPGGKQALSISNDRTMMLWTLVTGELLRTFTSPGGVMTCMAVSPDGRFAATGCDDGYAQLWDLQSDQMRGQMRIAGKCFGVAFSRDGQLIAVGNNSKDHPVQVWHWQDAPQLTSLKGWTDPLIDLCAFAGDRESRFVSIGGTPKAAADNTAHAELCIGSIQPGGTASTIKPLPGQNLPNRVAASANGAFIAVSFDHEVNIYDFPKLREITRLKGHGARVDSMRFLNGGRLLLTGSEDKSIRIWDRATGKELWKKEFKDSRSTSFVAVTEDETLALSGGGTPSRNPDDGCVLHLWKLPPMASLKSPEYVPTEADLADLASVDPDLAQLKKQLETEWDERVVKEDAAHREDLDKHYIEALQRKALTITSVAERDPYLDEISRVANKGPVPAAPPNGCPAELQHLIKIYIDQIAILRQKSADLAKSVLQEDEGRFSGVQNTRKQQGDEKGAARAKLLWQQWSRTHSAASDQGSRTS